MPWEQQWDIAFNTNMTHKGLCPLLCHITVSRSIPVASNHCSIPPRTGHTNLATTDEAILCQYQHSPKGHTHQKNPYQTYRASPVQQYHHVLVELAGDAYRYETCLLFAQLISLC